MYTAFIYLVQRDGQDGTDFVSTGICEEDAKDALRGGRGISFIRKAAGPEGVAPESAKIQQSGIVLLSGELQNVCTVGIHGLLY